MPNLQSRQFRKKPFVSNDSSSQVNFSLASIAWAAFHSATARQLCEFFSLLAPLAVDKSYHPAWLRSEFTP